MSFYEDRNKAILSEYLTSDQLSKVMSISGCLSSGISQGDALIISLLSLVSDDVRSCEAFQTLSTPTASFDTSISKNFELALDQAATLSFPTNLGEGCAGYGIITVGAGAPYTLTLGAGYFVSSGDVADISAGVEGNRFQLSWAYVDPTTVNVTILPLQ